MRTTVLLGTVLLAACGGAKTPPATAPQSAPAMGRVRLNDPVGIARARADSARLPYVKADIDFMSGMIPHHAQAIAMAKLAPTHGASPAIQRLTGRIINAQQDEIVLMQQWLADRRQPVPEADPRGMKMTMGGHEMMHLMPGMLSPAQMDSLDRARGPEFDRLFLPRSVLPPDRRLAGPRCIRVFEYSSERIEHIFELCCSCFSTYQRTLSRLARTNV
jgi:hypothetical protein